MKKSLHQYDHLFFASPFELVPPWNFDDLRQRAGQHFVIRRGRPRPDRGETYFVVPVGGGEAGERAATPIS
jgi:hypothetical protein